MAQPRRAIAAAITDRTSGKTANLAQEVAAYLVSRGRSSELESIMRDVIALRANQGIVEVTVVTARPLDDSSHRDVEAAVRQQYPTVKEIIISERHDASLVGGIRLEFPDRQLDLSVRARLNQFKQAVHNRSGERN